jgi:CubicO group peptidase (beta-lactamase class C family)
MKRLLPIAFMALSIIVMAQPARKPVAETIASLQKDLPTWMKDADIPGVQAVLIRNGKQVWLKSYGIANAETGVPVDDHTLFEAASLSKVITAYGAMKLVDEGKLDLDKPLNSYLGNNYDIGNDERIKLITARLVLSHSAGFPNWRPEGSPTLPINFNPGEKFSYSGEGFVYLSKVMEKLTQMDFEAYIQKAVFVPLGMTNSFFSWQDSFAYRHAYRHDWQGKKISRWEGKGFNAAASVHTTAGDYGKLMIALLNGKGLKRKTWEEMFTPQIRVSKDAYPELYWGLGVGLEITGSDKYFWHWGDQGDSKCYMKADLKTKDGFLYFTNSANGLSVADGILEDALGGSTPALAWLNYERYNPAVKMLRQSIFDKGVAAALQEYRDQRAKGTIQPIAETSINNIGYQLLRMEKVTDAIEVFLQNTADHPSSGNTWDSLAEAYMINGNKELAIKYYEKSLQLDPGNTNAADQLKKLKQ